MCFRIHPKHQIAKIAKRDIVCYKEIKNNMCPVFYTHIMKYKFNKLCFKVKIHIKHHRYVSNYIDKGYHSLSTKKQALLYHDYSGHTMIVKCIIPKNTKYYYNPDCREYVSENIFIQKQILL